MTQPRVAVSGSIAYDHIMSFGGSFADHIIPEKTHVISVSFLVDSLKKQRGGVAGNVSYNLALLGSSSYLVGAVGSDFGEYRSVFDALGINMNYVVESQEELTAAAFMMADQKDNQIASFFPGPGELANDIEVRRLGDQVDYAIVGPTAVSVMESHARQFGEASCKMIYDPAFQIILLTANQINEGIENAWCVIGNDYEFAMMERKTGLTIEDIANRAELVVVTYGEQGSELISKADRAKVPAAQGVTGVDPTGAGDAYRSGLIKGLQLGKDLEITGRIAGMTAAYAVEHVGTQEHFHTPEEYVERFAEAFPGYGSKISAELFAGP
jgi:adenosine kinase